MISVGVFLNSDGGSRRSLDDGLESNGVRIAKLDMGMNDLMERQGHRVKLHNALRSAINLQGEDQRQNEEHDRSGGPGVRDRRLKSGH
jgi:hypothetical protein